MGAWVAPLEECIAEFATLLNCLIALFQIDQPYQELVGFWRGGVGIRLLDAGVVDDVCLEVGVDGGDDVLHFYICSEDDMGHYLAENGGEGGRDLTYGTRPDGCPRTFCLPTCSRSQQGKSR